MDMHLSPEMEQLIQRHLASGRHASPEAVVRQALRAWNAEEPLPDDAESPLLAWLHATAGDRIGLEALRRRLSAMPGTMAETLRAERDERF